jgi:hypothetical protein
VAIRTSLLDAAAGAMVTRVASKVSRTDPRNALPAAMPVVSAATPANPATAMSADVPANARAGNQQMAAAAETLPGPNVFEPQVVDLKHPAPQDGAPDRQVTSASPMPSTPLEDSSDAAFVF